VVADGFGLGFGDDPDPPAPADDDNVAVGLGMMCVFYKSNVVGSVADLRLLIGWPRS